MFCSNCGKQTDDNAKFCGSCGAPNPLRAQASQPTPAQPAQQAPVTPRPQVQPAPAIPVVPVPRPQVPPAPVKVAPTTPPTPVNAQPARPVAPVPPRPQPQKAPVQPVAYNQPIQQPVQPAQPAAYSQPIQQPVQPVAYTQPVQPVQPAAYNQPPQQQFAGQPSNMKYQIFGANLPAVTITLNPGESIYTQSGGMVWMDEGITMETNMKGGLMKGLGRMFSGESLFIATYTASRPNQEIVIASTFPGSISAIELRGNSVIAQKTAFLCAQPTITTSAYLTKSLGAGLFGGEGFILQKLTGFGHVFLEIDGSLVERVLAPGEKIKVDTGNVAAFEETVQYQSEMVKGFKNILFGGEGLFLTTLTGPGKVWLQTMTMPTFAKQLIPFLPKPSSN